MKSRVRTMTSSSPMNMGERNRFRFEWETKAHTTVRILRLALLPSRPLANVVVAATAQQEVKVV